MHISKSVEFLILFRLGGYDYKYKDVIYTNLSIMCFYSLYAMPVGFLKYAYFCPAFTDAVMWRSW